MTPCNTASDLPQSGSAASFCSSSGPSGSRLSKSRSSDLQHSIHSSRSRDYAWGASASKHQHRINNGTRRPRTAPEERLREEPSPREYPRSPLTSSVTLKNNGNFSKSSYSTGRRLSSTRSPDGSDTGFLSPDSAHRMPRMSSLSSISSTMSYASGVVRAGSYGDSARPNAANRTFSVGSPSNPLAVISQQETMKQDESNCPICVESLDASFRLPGEKAHIVPECGHTIHEVSAPLATHENDTELGKRSFRLALWLYMAAFQSVSLPGGRIWESAAFVEHLCGFQMSRTRQLVPPGQAGMTVCDSSPWVCDVMPNRCVFVLQNSLPLWG